MVESGRDCPAKKQSGSHNTHLDIYCAHVYTTRALNNNVIFCFDCDTCQPLLWPRIHKHINKSLCKVFVLLSMLKDQQLVHFN